MYFEKILELTSATPTGSSGSFVGHCPTHEDNNKSLSITNSSGDKVLIKCHAGCTQESLISYFASNNAWGTTESVKKSEYYEQAKNLWNNSKEITKNDPVAIYLRNRGLSFNTFPNSLRTSSECYNAELRKNTYALIAKIQNFENEFMGTQRIFVSNDGNKLNVKAPKMTLGSVSGGYVELKSEFNDGEIHLAEGIENGLAIFLSFNKTTYCAVNAGNLSKVVPDKTVKTIQMWVDKDKSGTGLKEAEKAAKLFIKQGITVYLHLPKMDIPENKKGIDYLDVYVENPNAILEDFNNRIAFKNTIIPIKKPTYHLPEVTNEYLPLVLRDWIFEHAISMGVPIESIAVGIFSVLFSLIGKKLVLKPLQNGNWTVYSNIWGAIIGPPGSKKSAILNLSIKLLSEIEKEENLQGLKKLEELKFEIEEVDIKLADTRRKLKKAIEDDVEDSKHDLKIKLSDLEKSAESLKVLIKRYMVSAATPEKLIDLLKENSNGLLVTWDELNGLIGSFNRKGNESYRPFFLACWNAEGAYSYDTLSRGTTILDGPCLTVVGGTQPSIINKMLIELKLSRSDDGLLQRFQMISFPNETSDHGFIDIAVNKEHDKKVMQLLRDINQLIPHHHGERDTLNNVSVVKLDHEAYELFAKYMDTLAKEIPLAENDGYKNHLSKFGKLISGFILLFHLIDNIETKRSTHLAKSHVVVMAIRWTDLFKSHAKKLYDTDHNFEALSGFALAKKIIDAKVVDGMSLRAIYRNGWENLTTIDEVELACNFLETHNWLEVSEIKSKPGRPSTTVVLNPELPAFLSKGKWHE